MSGNYAYPSAVVLFSGGTDSTLCAVRTLELAETVHLVTFQPGFIGFLGNARKAAIRLAAVYGPERVGHAVIDNRALNRRFLFSRWRELLRRYGFHLSSLVCLGCRQAMHAGALAYCLERGIPLLADGSTQVQSDIPEQMESVLQRNRAMYAERFGVTSISPIYDEEHSDLKVWELGLAPRRELKRQFIFFEDQATCPFGVTADVYARLFYGVLMGREREASARNFLAACHALLARSVEEELARRGKALGPLVERLKAGGIQVAVAEGERLPVQIPRERQLARVARWIGRFAVATVLVPVGGLLGLGGLFQRWVWWFRRPPPPPEDSSFGPGEPGQGQNQGGGGEGQAQSERPGAEP